MSADVGKDIESLCSKCGDVWHVVVAKYDDGRIAKVQCKECGKLHKHRPPGGKAAKRKTSTRTRSRASAQTVTPRVSEPMVEPDLSRPTKTYDPRREDYELGDRLEHPKFGLGVVELVADPGKMQVFFPDGRRVLARAKPSSSLQRPRRIEFEPRGEMPDAPPDAPRGPSSQD